MDAVMIIKIASHWLPCR
ncbi:hypothetical protein VCHC52A1_1386, partial [Vibrio cholerae HC-52A1]